MSITVYAHVAKETEISVRLQESEVGKCAVLSAGGITVFINTREQLLEIASLLENAAQKWED